MKRRRPGEVLPRSLEVHDTLSYSHRQVDVIQAFEGAFALTGFAFRGDLFLIACLPCGRGSLANGLNFTGRRFEYERRIASMIRTSIKPSMPDGSGFFFSRMQSAK
jgi:hypothetical protein